MFSEARVILFTGGGGVGRSHPTPLEADSPSGGRPPSPFGGRPPSPFGGRPPSPFGGKPPWRQTPLEADPLVLTTSGGHCSSRHTSYWNTLPFFLFVLFVVFLWNSMALGGPAHGIATITVRRVGWWMGRVGLLGLGCPSKSRNLYVPLHVAQPCHIQLW